MRTAALSQKHNSGPKLPRCQPLVSDRKNHTVTSISRSSWIRKGWKKGIKIPLERERRTGSRPELCLVLDRGGRVAPHSSLLLHALFFRSSLRLSLLPFACRNLLLLVTPGIGRKRVPRQHFPDPFFSLPPSLADPSPLGFYFFKDSARLRARARHNR